MPEIERGTGLRARGRAAALRGGRDVGPVLVVTAGAERAVLRTRDRRRGGLRREHPLERAELVAAGSVLVHEDRRLLDVEARDLRVHVVVAHVRDHPSDDPVATLLGEPQVADVLCGRDARCGELRHERRRRRLRSGLPRLCARSRDRDRRDDRDDRDTCSCPTFRGAHRYSLRRFVWCHDRTREPSQGHRKGYPGWASNLPILRKIAGTLIVMGTTWTVARERSAASGRSRRARSTRRCSGSTSRSGTRRASFSWPASAAMPRAPGRWRSRRVSTRPFGAGPTRSSSTTGTHPTAQGARATP